MYEVFKPSNGYTIYRTRFLFLARFVSQLLHNKFNGGLDYAPEGEGWTS